MDIKTKLKQDGIASIGSWIQNPSLINVSLMAKAGFDWLAMDMEHGAISIHQLPELFQGLKGTDCEGFVRVSRPDPYVIKMALDAGATGIIVPMIHNATQAEEMVKACLYPPLGTRGIGFCQANDYGKNFHSYFNSINDSIFIVLQIESVEAVNEISDILSVKGIDAVMIGPYDLSGSMGIVGQFEHPLFLQAVQKVCDAAESSGVLAGVHVVQPNIEMLEYYLQNKYRFIAYGIDTVFLDTICCNHMREIRAKMGE